MGFKGRQALLPLQFPVQGFKKTAKNIVEF
jgi:hypothetical protein